MSRDPREAALRHHARLWEMYGPVVDRSPLEIHPIAFMARATTEADAHKIAAALRKIDYEILKITRKWWPPKRQWRVIAKTLPMPFTKDDTEQWVRTVATLLDLFDGVLHHWHPVEDGPVPNPRMDLPSADDSKEAE